MASATATSDPAACTKVHPQNAADGQTQPRSTKPSAPAAGTSGTSASTASPAQPRIPSATKNPAAITSGRSAAHHWRVAMLPRAYIAPASTGSTAASVAPDSACGPRTITTPRKPSTTAPALTGPTAWPKASLPISRTKIGAVNSPAATCATGRNASAPK